MADLEALIKKRIADHQFNDVVHVVAAQPEHRSKTVELDDTKSKKVRSVLCCACGGE